MAITYTWKFPQLTCYPTKDSKTNESKVSEGANNPES